MKLEQTDEETSLAYSLNGAGLGTAFSIKGRYYRTFRLNLANSKTYLLTDIGGKQEHESEVFHTTFV